MSTVIAGTVQSHGVGDPPGAHGEAVTQISVRSLQGLGIGMYELVVGVHQPDEHAGSRVGQFAPG